MRRDRRTLVRQAFLAGGSLIVGIPLGSTAAGAAKGRSFASLEELAEAGRVAQFGDEADVDQAGVEGRFTFTSDVGRALQEILRPLGSNQSMAVAAPRREGAPPGYWLRQVDEELRPEWFGAVGRSDGAADDTRALQVALSAVGLVGRRLRVSGRHTISNRLVISQRTNFSIYGGGEIVAAPGMPVRPDFQCLLISECSDFLVEDLAIDGNRQSRTPRETSAHTIELRSCNNFEFRNVQALNAVADCLYVACTSVDVADPGRHSSAALFSRCVFANGFRQAVSIIQGRSIRFENCRFAGSNGTAPSAGVDLESNSSDIDHAIQGVSFADCLFEENEGYGLLVASAKTPIDISATNCLFRENLRGAVSFQGRGGRLTDCGFEGFDGAKATRGCIDVGAAPEAGHLEIVRPRFSGIRNPSIAHFQVYVHAMNRGHVRLVDAAMQRGAFVAYFRGAGCHVSGGTFEGSPAGAITLNGSDCAVTDASFADFSGDIVRISGDRANVGACSFTDPAFNDERGIIRCLKGRGVQIAQNTFGGRGTGGTAITIAPAAAVSLVGNRFGRFRVHRPAT